jgi:TP901 family phage tail tape measure protein
VATNRDLIYRMTADPEGFKKGMRAAGKDSRLFYKELKALEEQQQAVDDVTTATGATLLGFGAAAGAGLALAAKAAISWESAWAGVTKVVDGSPEQLAALESELRGLATTLPQTHAEIAGVAEAAGQLGIARKDIAAFTSTMVAMGVSTDLSSQDAATSMARLMNIMQTAPDDVNRLGSAIVGLGNAGASTESEIVEMALRLAGAGHTVGMTEADVLGLSSALASVGIEAEAGGSAFSTAMIKIEEAVNEGGESLDTFASVAGMSAQEFATKWGQDPAGAIDAFVQGLGRMQARGQDVFGVLESLGLSEIRLRDALLRLAGAGDLLTESLQGGNAAWDENSALMEEAARRYGTTEAQLGIAKNQLTDLGIQLGDTLLPIINDFLQSGRGFFAWFNELSPAIKEAIVQFGLAATAIGIMGGAALIAAPRMAALSVSLLQMGGAGAKAAGTALAGVSRILGGPWGAAIGVGTAIIGKFAMEQAKAKGRVEDLSNSLDAQTGAVTDNTRVLIANELQQRGLIDTAKSLGIGISTLVSAIEGDPAAMEAVNNAIARRREELIELAGTSDSNLTEIDAERAALTALQEGMSGLSGETQEAIDKKQEQIELQEGATQATKEESGANQVLAETLGIAADGASAAADAFGDLDEKVRALIDSAFALNGAQRDVEEGIDNITEKLQENGATIDRNTEAGRENEQAIEDQVAAIASLALTTAEQTGSAEEANAVLAEQRNRLHDVLKAAGFTEAQIDSYIGVLDNVPGEIETAISTPGLSNAINRAQYLDRWLDSIDRTVTISFQYENFMPRGGVAIPKKDGGIVGYADGGLPSFPDGGMFSGRGGPRDDANLVAISDGEFIVNARDTARHRALLEAINSGRLPLSGTTRPAIGRRFSSSGSEKTVTIKFDAAGVSNSALARALREMVYIEGGGNAQDAIGTR